MAFWDRVKRFNTDITISEKKSQESAYTPVCDSVCACVCLCIQLTMEVFGILCGIKQVI